MRPVRCLLTCQGSAQLAAGIAAMKLRREERLSELGSRAREESLLVFIGAAPDDQFEAFAQFVHRLSTIQSWTRFVSIPPARLAGLEDLCRQGAAGDAGLLIHDLLDTDRVDEVFVATGWQLKNRMFMQAYPEATAYCYGDGLGIYYPESYQAVRKSQEAPSRRGLKARIRRTLRWARGRADVRVAIPARPFRRGYFVFPGVFGVAPPMPHTRIPRTTILSVLQRLVPRVDPAVTKRFRDTVGTAPLSILLTANFSESGAITAQREIDAYHRFLQAHACNPDSVLVLKPHPRDDFGKTRRLRKTLEPDFCRTVVLSDPSLAFLPFEVFLMAALLDDEYTPRNPVEVYAVSSACLSLPYLFGLSVHLGLGEDIVTRMFDPAYVPRRLKHETELREGLARLPRYPDSQEIR